METLKTFAVALKTAYNMLYDYEFKAGARMKPTDFTRERKMNFVNTMLLILRGTKKGLQASVNAFFKETRQEYEMYSKQAFSKGRQRIKPEAFLELFQAVTQSYYRNSSFKTFHGFRVSAIDGVIYNLPNTDELQHLYGGEKIKGKIPQVQAQGSCLYDVLNSVLMDVQLFPFQANERKIAEMHLEKLERLGQKNELIIMDRGYPSRELIEQFNQKGIHYLIRFPKNGFLKETRNCKTADETVTYTFKGKTTLLRILTVQLENGTEETLLTNVFDEGITLRDFKELYHLRWRIETKYEDIKSKLQIENFSGTTLAAILQDFYATMFLTNMAAFAQIDCQEALEKRQKNCEWKYEYKVNFSMLISTLKLDFISLFLETSQRKRNRQFKSVMKKILQNIVPIRNGRSFPRKRKHISLRFHNTRKFL